MKTVIEAKQVKKVYGDKGNLFCALDQINVTVQSGEFVGIMGPSGAGKSTFLHLIGTIDEPTSGEIWIDGVNLSDMNEEKLSLFRREKLGFIFQDYHLLDTLTVKENILLPLTLSDVKVSEMEKRVNEIAERFGIDSILDKLPHQISGGEKQRTAASRTLVTQPSLLLADEPTGALDSRSASDLLESLREVNDRDQITIFMVTHDPLAASYCKRVLFIKDGGIFTELVKGDRSRKEFFKKVLDTVSVLGGGQG